MWVATSLFVTSTLVLLVIHRPQEYTTAPHLHTHTHTHTYHFPSSPQPLFQTRAWRPGSAHTRGHRSPQSMDQNCPAPWCQRHSRWGSPLCWAWSHTPRTAGTLHHGASCCICWKTHIILHCLHIIIWWNLHHAPLFVPAEIHIILFVFAETHIMLHYLLKLITLCCWCMLNPTSHSTICIYMLNPSLGSIICIYYTEPLITLHYWCMLNPTSHSTICIDMLNPSLGSIICMYYAEPLYYLYGHVKALITFHYLNIYWTPHHALLFPLYLLHCCHRFLKHKWSFSLHWKYAVVHFGANGRPRVT